MHAPRNPLTKESLVARCIRTTSRLLLRERSGAHGELWRSPLVQVADKHACTSIGEVRQECDLIAFVETSLAKGQRADGRAGESIPGADDAPIR